MIKNFKTNRVIILLGLVLLTSTHSFASPPEAASESLVITMKENPKTSGCVAGFLAGTLIPGIGNVVGCAVGIFTGWWVSD